MKRKHEIQKLKNDWDRLSRKGGAESNAAMLVIEKNLERLGAPIDDDSELKARVVFNKKISKAPPIDTEAFPEIEGEMFKDWG